MLFTEKEKAGLLARHYNSPSEILDVAVAAVIKRLAAGVRVEPVAYYANHRLTPEGTTEFYGYADKKLEPSTMLYTAEAIAAARVQENERCAVHCNGERNQFPILASEIRALLGGPSHG